jgi:hypothetical protein
MKLEENGKIKLTVDEIELYKLTTTLPDNDPIKWQAQYELFKSLSQRDTIPQVRLKFFLDPAYNWHNTKKSRQAVFTDNGTIGNNIYAHPNFAKYLSYFIEGPKVSSEIKAIFKKSFDDRKPITSGDSTELLTIFRANIKTNDRNEDFAEECYKLVLENVDSPFLAENVRKAMMK